ncbi:hypothetical protein B0H14DRAFT_3679427 [Mycena olivaceomarginata]|nr:hypothetical protein B0H14DRAFT_3679427 [Mycena olivaceomarginata]
MPWGAPLEVNEHSHPESHAEFQWNPAEIRLKTALEGAGRPTKSAAAAIGSDIFCASTSPSFPTIWTSPSGVSGPRALTMEMNPSFFSGSQRLPSELECAIFEIAALARPNAIPSLMLVARRLLYRVIMVIHPDEFPKHRLDFPVFTVERLREVIRTKPLEFLQNAVQYLYIDAYMQQAELEAIVTTCNRVENLFNFNTTNLRVMGGLRHLRYLIVSLYDFLKFCGVQATLSALDKITHLELLNTADTDIEDPRFDALSAHLSSMSRLTHIAFDSVPHDLSLQTALRAKKDLRCILLLAPAAYLYQRLQNVYPLLREDIRFLCLHQDKDFREDWLQGAATGETYWVVAEAFIAARRDGKVDRSRYAISDMDISWRDCVDRGVIT